MKSFQNQTQAHWMNTTGNIKSSNSYTRFPLVATQVIPTLKSLSFTEVFRNAFPYQTRTTATSWGDSSSWISGVVPGDRSIVFITNNANVTLDIDRVAQYLFIDSGDNLGVC